jgi:hypothetical protein
MTADKPMSDDAKVWRYMSFSRFIWLLQKKQLWLSRADRLGDPWEISLANNQLEHVISRHPITPITEGIRPRENAMQRSVRINKLWRQRTFVSCWNASDHESHALWRIYCGSSDGVALQTTFDRLRESVGGLPVYRVAYEIPGMRKQTPTLVDLVTKKRPMFAYEQEVRVVRDATTEPIHEQEVLGHTLEWNPDLILQSVLIHPEADFSFMETVTAAVAHYAPALKDSVVWSAMREPPPLLKRLAEQGHYAT